MCRPGIERPDVVRRRHVQNAIDKDRSGLDLRGLSGFEGPGERKLVDVRRSNLRQSAMVLTRVCAVIGRPTLAWRLQECTGIQSLSKCRALERKHHQNQTRSRTSAAAPAGVEHAVKQRQSPKPARYAGEVCARRVAFRAPTGPVEILLPVFGTASLQIFHLNGTPPPFLGGYLDLLIVNKCH